MSDDCDLSSDPLAQRVAVRDGYDDPELAEAYRQQRETHDVAVASHVDDLVAALDAGDRVVDVGCGQGVPVLNRLPSEVEGVGVDLSATMLETARERTDAALVRGDMTRLPVADATAAAVTAVTSTIHVPVAEHPTVYAEFARVLAPGGRLLLTAATGEEGWAGVNPDWLGSGGTMAWSFPGVDQTREHLRAAGFRVTAEHHLDETVSDDDSDGGSWALIVAELSEE
ncbi:class I SAM-dependent methyltransferase [Halobaculum marinum]|uniref:Class I SAM-dependent methyltransferase n=1 Tax=Halobaculum marinum TaxID=3031996 RepID=A0ABD5WYQ4_9EURY|nr:class I SAM-dependent methyltransferase [Halobaculum sp. DT55]